MKTKILSTFCLAHLLLAATPSRSAVFIDTFETQQHLQLPDKKHHIDSSAAGSGIFGGERDVTLERVAGRDRVSGGVLDGLFTLNNDDDTAGGATISWDGFDDSPHYKKGGLGAFDLTQSDANQKFIFSAASDLGALITIRIYESKNRYSEANVLIPGGEGLEYYFVNFRDFIPARQGGARFDQVEAIAVEITGVPRGGEAAFGSFAAVPLSFVPVPEAATWIAALSCVVLAIVMMVRRSAT